MQTATVQHLSGPRAAATAKCLAEKPFYSKHGGLRRKRGALLQPVGQGVGYADSVGSAIFGRVCDRRAGQTIKSGDNLSISVCRTQNWIARSSSIRAARSLRWPAHSGTRPHAPSHRKHPEGKLKPNYNEALDITVALGVAKPDPEEDLKPKIFITGEVIRPGSYVVRQNHTDAGDRPCRRRVLCREATAPGETTRYWR